jgi:hypothetical protein
MSVEEKDMCIWCTQKRSANSRECFTCIGKERRRLDDVYVKGETNEEKLRSMETVFFNELGELESRCESERLSVKMEYEQRINKLEKAMDEQNAEFVKMKQLLLALSSKVEIKPFLT